MTRPLADEEAIFLAARAHRDPVERAAFLVAACNDGQLQERVERLLALDDEREGPLDQSPLGSITSPSTFGEQVGAQIGPYKLVEQLGEGGFGMVYLAEQERPVRRKVALKIIKPGMDTRQVIARFEAERQALALMDHPNIAKVHDAGTTENGRPFFVMELVGGVPITEYCDQCNLTPRERLALFVTVCQAVQHAHQKGIIHRDLKPTNVLVATQDGEPVPKIIDFGVAKATGQRLTEHTLATGATQIIGTPLYMSPEQAELSPLGADTRSDIYSLGVVLFELLTGTTPFDKQRLCAVGYDELRRIIREEDPPRPSTRFSTLDAQLATTVAEHRRTDTRRLLQTVRGELDWIVMKCLEKDRSRRYETANGLARDLERYLHDEAVQACPPSAAYRVKKLIRRNKIAAAFVVLLVAAVAALSISDFRTTKSKRRAVSENARATAISQLLLEMLVSSNSERAKDSQHAFRELLADFSLGLDDQLAGEPEMEAAIRSVIGKAYWRAGAHADAELHLKRALDLRRKLFGAGDERVADILVDYAWSIGDQRRNAEAERCACEALSIYQNHQSDLRSALRAHWSLQNFLNNQSKLAEAEQVANDALTLAGDIDNTDNAEVANILHDLAQTKWQQGKYHEAEQWARRSVALHRRLHGNQHSETAWGLWNLGRALRHQHHLAEAETALRESLSIVRKRYSSEHNSVRAVIGELTLVLEARRDRAGLEALASEARAISLDSPAYHVRLAEVLLSSNPPNAAQKDEARRLIGRAIERYAQMATDSRRDFDRRLKAAIGLVGLIKVSAAVPDFADEVDKANRILKLEYAELIAAVPDRAALAEAHYYVALMQLQVGDKAGYRATSKALVELPVDSANLSTIWRPIWTSCLAPDALDDLNPLVARAEEYFANVAQNRRHFGLYILGAALYRARQFERAAERLSESGIEFQRDPLSTGAQNDGRNYQQLLLAMAKWQLGQRDEARHLLAETLTAVDAEHQSPASTWNRRATLEILRREAEELIGQKQAEVTENAQRRTLWRRGLVTGSRLNRK
jgi:serine/threonine protein kinase